jgi:hypothetical protein
MMWMIRIHATTATSASAAGRPARTSLRFLRTFQQPQQQQIPCCNSSAVLADQLNRRHCYHTPATAVLRRSIADIQRRDIHQRRNLSSSRTSSTESDHGDEGDNDDNKRKAATTTTANDNGNVVVYESPFGALVTKLRVVSLMTGVFGSIGLPLAATFLSSTAVTTPTTGFVALCLTFGTGTIATTLAIQYVFGPYVYSIERIPIRKCHYKKNKTSTMSQNTHDTDTSEIDETTTTTTKYETENTTNTAPNNVDDTCVTGPHFLYLAKSKSIFIRPVETVFDANADDVQKYTGFTLPLCNFTAKGRPLYMHTEYLRLDDQLYSRMQQIENDGSSKKKYKTPPKGNPDDDFL